MGVKKLLPKVALGALPLAHGAATAEDWLARFEQGRLKLKEWFPAGEEALSDHTHLGTASRFYLLPGCQREKKTWTDKTGKKGHDHRLGHSNRQESRLAKVDSDTKEGAGRNDDHGRKKQKRVYQPWEVALDAAGKIMQKFRQRRTIGDPNSDYERINIYLNNNHHRQNILSHPPERAAFGLPLTFRYNSLKFNGKIPEVTFQGEYEQHDRSASPLFIRVVEIAGQCHPFFALLEAPLLAPDEDIKDSEGDNTWSPPDRSLLLTFCETKLSPKAIGELRCDRQL